MKYFPIIPRGWTATATFFILDDTITEDVFLYHMQQAGMLIGLGSFRVRNNGVMGRFKVVDMAWEDKEMEDLLNANKAA